MATQNPTEIVLDIEADGLEPTTIWCVVAQVIGQREPEIFLEEDHEQFQNFINNNKGATVYAHNGLGYDYHVLRELWGSTFSGVVLRDTLVLSRLAEPSRGGGHGLESWGNQLGYAKGEFDEWDRYSEEMLDYCKRDVQVTERVLQAVKRELGKSFTSYAVELEHKVATVIDQQVINGWKLDVQYCYELLGELADEIQDAEEEVHKRFRPRMVKVKEICPKRNKDGSTSKVGLKFLGEDCLDLVGGRFSRVDICDFNLGSRQQIGDYLQRFGWVPKRFTPTGQPIVSEEILEHVDIPEAQVIARYLMLVKRQAMVRSWLDAADDNDRVHGYVNPIGAVTGRMTHSSPNVAQVTAKGKPYGAELRSCWIVEPGYKLVGCDADGLELRMLAHYMNDDDYVKTVTEGNKDDGTDAHSVNQQAAGLPTRDNAKVFIYAYLYGAGDAKIGSIIGQSRQAGRRIKHQFERRLPALSRLKTRVSTAAGRGWLRGLDGRQIAVRSDHAALNTLLQGAGAVVMKEALLYLHDMAEHAALDYKFVGNIHDEIQAEVHEDDAEAFARLAERAMTLAGEHFNLRCPLAGTATIGNTWKETH